MVDGEVVEKDVVAEPAEAGRLARDEQERAGLVLAALAALVVPSLIVLALYLPALSPSGGGGDRTTGISNNSARLDQVELEATLETTSEQSVAVAGAGEAQSDVDTEIGEAAGILADEDAIDRIDAPSLEQAPTDTQIAAPTTAATPPTAAPGSPSPDTTGEATTTTIAATTTTATQQTTTTTTTTTVVDVEPAQFSQRIDFGRIGETTVQFRFMADSSTGYTTTVRNGTAVVVQTSGSAQANVLVNETVGNLSAGTEYTVQVALDGPPGVSSPRVSFRTSGGQTEAIVDDVAVVDLRVAEVGSTRFEVHYESNICANGSFVIREQGGGVAGRNAGQVSGCTTRHLGIPGFWTAPLQPATTYVITVQVEANGAGQGDGNIATQSLTVTTNA